MSARRPEFVVVGGSRCGTTSLHAALVRHPSLFVPPEKSPNYFTAPDVDALPDSTALRAMKGHSVTSEHEYLQLFAQAPSSRLAGEVSPVYLQSVHTAARLAAFAPECRIIAMLRHPVHRAYAHWLGRRRDGLDAHDQFAAAIADDLANPAPRDVAFNRYLAIGRYAHYLAPFYAAFPRERIKVVFFDDFAASPRAVIDDVCQFLGVPSLGDAVPMEQRNKGGIIRNPVLRALWTRTALQRARLRGVLPAAVRDAVGQVVLRDLERPRIEPALASSLVAYFLQDIAALEQLVARDLTAWRRA
jgi:Sulfotransferase family